ncbi:hypothetical protein Tco_0031979 [Tanacetum coccineum]
MLTKPQVFYDNNLKQAPGFQNPFYLKKAQQIRSILYDGNCYCKETNVISIADSEETLMLKEESRSKMLLKQSDPMVLEKKVNTKPINYAELNRLSEDFGKCFVPQRELSDEQALHPITDQSASSLSKFIGSWELPKLIQELLGYVRDTFPDIHKPGEKLVAIMPINKKKKVDLLTRSNSSGNIPKATNRPLLSSTGVNPSTSASGSKPLGNTKNDRISRTLSSNENNNVEVQSRKVKSSLNKRNSDSKKKL